LLEKYARALDTDAAGTPKKITEVVEDASTLVSTDGEEQATGQAAVADDDRITEAPVSICGKLTDTRWRIDDFLRSAGRFPGVVRKLRRNDFWGACGYTNDRQFRDYQNEASGCSALARKNFDRLIKDGPEKFVTLLHSKGMLKDRPHFS